MGFKVQLHERADIGGRKVGVAGVDEAIRLDEDLVIQAGNIRQGMVAADQIDGALHKTSGKIEAGKKLGG